MSRILIKVAYDGTNYAGWQFQQNANTIEAELNKGLSILLNENITVIGASRTDSGVHALSNIAVFDTNTSIPPAKISLALNSHLPLDIRILESREVDADFHPRKCKSIKTYRYCIDNSPIYNPIKSRYSLSITSELDINAMITGAILLVGEHDFKSFCSVHTQAKTTVRTIRNIDIFKEADLLIIEVSGEGFLYNMVRIIAGTLVDVGLGKIAPSDISHIMVALDRQKAGRTLPANGLVLHNFEFESPI